MKKTPSKTKPVVFSANIEQMIKNVEKNPRQGSCTVVDVLEDLMIMGHEEWEKKHRPHKRQTSNK